MLRALIVCVSLCVALLDGPVFAGKRQDGLSAYDRGEYAEAVRVLRPLAEGGDQVAQNALGLMYELGLGVGKDLKAAARWFELAAKGGNPEGQNNLAVMYSLGEGVQRNPKIALRWYRRAAGKGHAVAQYNLGLVYEEGVGTRKNHTEAARWYALAAAQDLEPAQHNLAMLYNLGQGVARNPARAAALLKRAAAHGFAPSQNNLGMMYFNGSGLSKDVVLAHLWFALAAEQGNVAALVNLLLVREEMTPEQISEADGLYRAWKGRGGTSDRGSNPARQAMYQRRRTMEREPFCSALLKRQRNAGDISRLRLNGDGLAASLCGDRE